MNEVYDTNWRENVKKLGLQGLRKNDDWPLTWNVELLRIVNMWEYVQRNCGFGRIAVGVEISCYIWNTEEMMMIRTRGCSKTSPNYNVLNRWDYRMEPIWTFDMEITRE